MVVAPLDVDHQVSEKRTRLAAVGAGRHEPRK